MSDLTQKLKNIETYEIALARNPAQAPLKDDGGILLLKDQGDDSMPQEEENELSLEDALKDVLDRSELSKDEAWEKIDELKPEKETEEEEKNLSPKAKNAIKDVLGNLTDIRSEIPAEYQWVFSALAKMAGYPSPYGYGDYGYPNYTSYKYPKAGYGYPQSGYPQAAKEKEFDGEVKEVVNESIETLDKIEDKPEEGGWIVDALEQLSKEVTKMTEEAEKKADKKEEVEETEEEETKEEQEKETLADQLNKETQEKVEKMQDALEKKEERITKLEKEKLEKELIEKAEQFKDLPADTEELVKLFKDLHRNENLEPVTELLSKLQKEVENSELFKSKGETGSEENEPETTLDKIEKETKKLIEKENLSRAEAMTQVMEDEELREEYAEEKRGA